MTILLIDESQKLFKSNDDFWERMKLGTQLCLKSRSLIVVMAAAYGLAASPYGQHSWQNPNVDIDPTSSAQQCVSQQCVSIASEKLDQLSISGHFKCRGSNFWGKCRFLVFATFFVFTGIDTF